MIDINSFLIMILGMLSSILLVILIILGIKLINTVNKIDNLIDGVENRLNKMDKMFGIVDTITDSLTLVSDKIVDGIMNLIKKVFTKKDRKEEGNYE